MTGQTPHHAAAAAKATPNRWLSSSPALPEALERRPPARQRDTRKARAAAARRLQRSGRSAQALGELKKRRALHWVYRWGWSSAALLDAITQRGKRGLAARLVRQGLLVAHPCAGAGGIRGVPQRVLTLSAAGVAVLEAHLPDNALLGYEAGGARYILWRQLRHDHLVQRTSAQQLLARKITGVFTPREIAARSAAGIKQPDAVWRTPEGLLIALELELTVKKGRELDQTVAALLKAVQPAGGPFDAVAILTPSAAIRERYRRALAPGAHLQHWSRDSARRWITAGSSTLPAWSGETFLFEEVQL